MRPPRLAGLLVVLVVAAVLRVGDANPAMAQTQMIGAWRVTSEPGLDGSAPEWQSILPVFVVTTAQQVTPPMGGGTVERVAVRAVHWEEKLYVMLEWADPTANHHSDRHETFTDAAAIQFPAEGGSAVPSYCMGQADQAVNIWQWRADLQSPLPEFPVDGYVDLYPSTDDLYFPAREAGNHLSSQHRRGAHNLVAGGFGTLEPIDHQGLEGQGVYSNGRWSVVFTRPFQPVGDMQPVFDVQTPIDVAFAVWDGSKQERDGIKSVSLFTRLSITPEDPPRRAVAATDDWPAYTPPNPLLGYSIGFIIVMLIITGSVWWYMSRQSRERDADQS